jgi:hypothetical protein
MKLCLNNIASIFRVKIKEMYYVFTSLDARMNNIASIFRVKIKEMYYVFTSLDARFIIRFTRESLKWKLGLIYGISQHYVPQDRPVCRNINLLFSILQDGHSTAPTHA